MRLGVADRSRVLVETGMGAVTEPETGQASNVVIARFAKEVANVDLTYTRWILGGVVLPLALVPALAVGEWLRADRLPPDD